MGPSADSQERFGGKLSKWRDIAFLCKVREEIPIDNKQAGKMEDQFETQISSNNEVLTF